MPAPTIPEGKTLVDVLKRPWSAVPVKKHGTDVAVSGLISEATPQVANDRQIWATTNLVPTSEFLEACESLTVVFGWYSVRNPGQICSISLIIACNIAK